MAGTEKQENSRPKLVGVNHIALEVGDIEEALAFYGRIFDFSCAARARVRPSSIWAISSSP
jgi:catechol-2,3-dioxygenase